MRISRLRFLALLGFLGLLGLVTGNNGFYGFFGFFGFWAFRSRSDELLEKNSARAGFNAFVVSLVGLAIAIAVVSLTGSLMVAGGSIMAVFAAQIVTFVVSLNLYERRGDLE